MGNIEDAVMQLYIHETEKKAKKIHRTAKDICAEINRFKREDRNTKKQVASILAASLMKTSEGEPLVTNWFGDLSVHYYIDTGHWMTELEKLIKNGGLIPKNVEKALGILFDYSPIKIPATRDIRAQIAAQIRWYEYPSANIDEVKQKLLTDLPIYEFLELDKLESTTNPDSRFRGLEDRIRPANPRGKQKGRHSKTGIVVPTINPLPLVYNQATWQLNGKALYIAVIAIATILKLWSKTYAEIIAHPVTMCYKSYAGSIDFLIDSWIKEV